MGTLSSTLARRKVASVAVKEREPDGRTRLDVTDKQNTVITNDVRNVNRELHKVSFISEEGKCSAFSLQTVCCLSSKLRSSAVWASRVQTELNSKAYAIMLRRSYLPGPNSYRQCSDILYF